METEPIINFLFDQADGRSKKLTKHGRAHGQRGLQRFRHLSEKVHALHPVSELEGAEISIAIYLHDLGRMFGSRPHYVMGALLVYLLLALYRVPHQSRYRIAYAIRYHAPEHVLAGKLKYAIQAWLIAIDKSLDGAKRVRKEEREELEALAERGSIREYCSCPALGPHILRGSGTSHLGDHAHHHLVNIALCDPQPRFETRVTENEEIIVELIMGLDTRFATQELLFALFGPRFVALLKCFEYLGIRADIVLIVNGVREHYIESEGVFNLVETE